MSNSYPRRENIQVSQELVSNKIMEKEKLERLLNVAIKVLLGDEHEENGTYSLYFDRKLYIDTNGDKRKIAELFNEGKLDIVEMPEYPYDNHCGLKLKYKGEKED